MILKAVSMSWLTVVRMMQVKGRFRSPEDLRETPFNPEPNPRQLEPNEYVERIRRIQLNDLENLPLFPGGRFPLRLNRAVAPARASSPPWLRRFKASAFCSIFYRSDARNAPRSGRWVLR